MGAKLPASAVPRGTPRGEASTRGGLGSWRGVRLGRWSDDDDEVEGEGDEGGGDDEAAGKAAAEAAAEEAAAEEAEALAQAAPPVECGDVGGLLRRFLERYSRGPLRVDDPMPGGGGSDIGAKAFRFPEVRIVLTLTLPLTLPLPLTLTLTLTLTPHTACRCLSLPLPASTPP